MGMRSWCALGRASDAWRSVSYVEEAITPGRTTIISELMRLRQRGLCSSISVLKFPMLFWSSGMLIRNSTVLEKWQRSPPMTSPSCVGALKTMNKAQLTEMAQNLGVAGATNMAKQELIFQILRVQAERDRPIFSEGVLEVLI